MKSCFVEQGLMNFISKLWMFVAHVDIFLWTQGTKCTFLRAIMARFFAYLQKTLLATPCVPSKCGLLLTLYPFTATLEGLKKMMKLIFPSECESTEYSLLLFLHLDMKSSYSWSKVNQMQKVYLKYVYK